mgnify:CR=1 FL=1
MFSSSHHVSLAVTGVTAFACGSMCVYIYQKFQHKKKKRPASGTPDIATSPEDFITGGGLLLNWIVNYRKQCRELPVISTVEHNYLKVSF